MKENISNKIDDTQLLEELLKSVKGNQQVIEMFISTTETGDLRTRLCDTNTKLLSLIERTEQRISASSQFSQEGQEDKLKRGK